MSFAETAETAVSPLPNPVTLGLATILHRLPFQCSISVRCTKLAVVELPTAQISLAAMAVTPARVFSVAPFTLGLATTLHCLPFQCSTSVELPLPLPYSPTAQTLVAETAAMLY